MKIFYFLTSLLLCLKAFSGIVFERHDLQGRDIAILHSEENSEGKHFLLDIFREDHGELQDFKSRKSIYSSNEIIRLIDSGFSLKQSFDQSFLGDDKVTDFNQESVQEIDQSNSIWPATKSWNLNWEKRYSSWIQDEIKPDFFVKHNLPSDCADIIVGLRWIFARMHGLPSAHHLAGSGRLFSNYSLKSSWKSLPTDPEWSKDRRFLASLRYLMNNTYTGSLRSDTYPVRIDSNYLVPGSMHLSTKFARHVVLFKDIKNRGDQKDSLMIIESTLPPKVRELYTRPFLFKDVEPYGKGGILNLKWPVVSNGSLVLKSGVSMPGFSKEQFEKSFTGIAFDLFHLSVMRKINPDVSDKTFLVLKSDGFKAQIKKRDQLVLDGYKVCRRQNCAPGTQNYFFWSTPSRDKKMKNLIAGAEKILKESNQSTEGVWENSLNQKVRLKSLNNERYSIEKIVDSFKNNRFNSDPRSNPRKRWGL